jgi:hypothetical protein
MILFRVLFWLLALPFRLVFWVVGLALWLLTLPLRLVFGFLGLIGFGRLFQLAVIGGVGYFFYRLVNAPPSSDDVDAGPTAEELEKVPTT